MTINTNYDLKVNMERETTPSSVASSSANNSASIFITAAAQNEVNNESTNTSNSVQTNSSNEEVEELYREVEGIVAPLGISKEELKSKNVISQVAGNINEAELLKNSDELQRIKECIRIAVKVVQAKKLEPTAENLINYANDINVATVTNAYTLEEIENSISSTKYKLDFDSIEEKIEKFYTKIKDFDSLNDEEKIEYITKFFSYFSNDIIKNGKYSEERALEMQLQQYVRLIANTEDAHNRALLINAIDSLAEINQFPALKSWITSFKNKEEKTQMAHEATEDLVNNILDNENVTPDDALGIKIDIASSKSRKDAIKQIKEINKTRKEFFKEHSIEEIQLLERKKEIIEKKENNEELTEEEEIFLEKNGTALTEEEEDTLRKYENTIVASDTAVDIGYQQNENLTPKQAQRLLRKNHRNMQKYGNYYTEEVMKSVHEYVTEHKDTLGFSEEELTAFLDKVTNGEYSNYVNSLNAAQTDADGTGYNGETPSTAESSSGGTSYTSTSTGTEIPYIGYNYSINTYGSTEQPEQAEAGEQAQTNNTVNSERAEEETPLSTTTEEKTTKITYIENCKTSEDVRKCLDENKNSTIIRGLNYCKKIGIGALKYLQMVYSGLDENNQTTIIKNLNSDGMSVAETYTKDGAFKDIVEEGYIFGNSAMTARIYKKNAEIEEKEQKVNNSVFTAYNPV